MKYIWASLVIALALVTKAQTGDFVLTHHHPKHSEIDNVNFDILTDNHGVIQVANRFGLLKYDGETWDFYRTPSSALSIAVDPNTNTSFVGCIGGFGKMQVINNAYVYQSMLENDSLDDHFNHTFIHRNSVYFLSHNSLYQVDLLTENIVQHLEGNFLNTYTWGDNLYINTDDYRTHLVTLSGLQEQPEGSVQWGRIAPSPDGKSTYAADLEGTIYRLEDGAFERLEINDRLQDASVTVTGLTWVNDTLLATSTLQDGILFLSSQTRSYFENTDYHSGLPDNEIFAMHADVDGGLWVAHEFGLTRISPLFPAYNYSHFPGLEGNLVEAQRLNGDLWVTTSLGVYYFNQDTSYREEVRERRVVRRGTRAVTRAVTVPGTQTVTRTVQEPVQQDENSGNRKRGFLSGLFKKRERSEQVQTREIKEVKGVFKKVYKKEYIPTRNVSIVREVERIVTGINYGFKKVPGTDGKFRQLFEIGNKLLATSLNGVYEITKNGALRVISENVRYAYAIPEQEVLLVSTADGTLKSYQYYGNVWQQESDYYFEDFVLNAYVDSEENVWLAGTTHIYRGTIDDGAFDIQDQYEINNRFYDELSIWERDHNLYFINTQGYYRYDRDKELIVKDPEVAEEFGVAHHHVHTEEKMVWLYDGKIWKALKSLGETEEFNYMGVFPDLIYISYDEALQRYWLLTSDNQLLAFAPHREVRQSSQSRVFIKQISSDKGILPLTEQIKFRYDDSFISVELSKPDYLGILKPEYQYKLQGKHDDWSEWTRANLIDFSFLPPGNYELQARVRDSFGNIEEAKPVRFIVPAPYWQQPWFYLVQVLGLGMIIFFTTRLNQEKPINRFIKGALSVLTLVLIIELIQAVISGNLALESTPVVDFLIDAGVALMVFPLEALLRSLMLEGGTAKIKKRFQKVFS